MRILLIITDYGSFNNFLSEVAVTLLQNGHDVHVLCSPSKVINCKDKQPYADMGIKIEYVNFPRSFNPFKQLAASINIHKKINAINPDLINVHFTTGIFTTLLWRKPAYFTIGTIHGVGYPMIKQKIKRAIFESIEKFCFRRLDQIYLINEYDYELVSQLHPQKTFKYSSYGVGNDVHKFDPQTITEHDRDGLRSELMIKDDDFVLAFTGRFVAFKGFDKVVKTFNALVKHYKIHDIKLLIIGGDDPIHPNGLNKEEDTDYKSSEQIINIPFTADVNKYLAVADVFVFPSIKEGMPVCIMEALSMGVPVITSNSRGCNDLIKHGFNGLLLSDDPTIAEIREAVLKLYRDRTLLQNLSENALSKRTEYNREKYVREQVDAYSHTAGSFNSNLALS
jgi:glycosyltransferase involved in cell wall biosynthesis